VIPTADNSTEKYDIEDPGVLKLFLERLELGIVRAMDEMKAKPKATIKCLRKNDWSYLRFYNTINAKFSYVAAEHVFDSAYDRLIETGWQLRTDSGWTLPTSDDQQQQTECTAAAPDAPQSDSVKKPTRILPPAPQIDLKAIEAEESAIADALRFKHVVPDDIDDMEPAIKAMVSAAAFDIMNQTFARNSRRKLTWRELAFVACLHRKAIMTQHHNIEDGRHCGESAQNLCEKFTDEEYAALKIAPVKRQHAADIYEMLEKRDFAECIEEAVFISANNPLNKARRYAAKPSEFWGFPSLNND
jgi:hypothetical protein